MLEAFLPDFTWDQDFFEQAEQWKLSQFVQVDQGPCIQQDKAVLICRHAAPIRRLP